MNSARKSISKDHGNNKNASDTIKTNVAELTSVDHSYSVKLDSNELIQYDKQSDHGLNEKNIGVPLNSFSFKDYGTNKYDYDNDRKQINTFKKSGDEPAGDGTEGVVNVASIIGNIGWFQLLVLVFSGLRECSVGYDALITSIMLQPEHDFVCNSGIKPSNESAEDYNIDYDDDSSLMIGGSRHGAANMHSISNSTSNKTAACFRSNPVNGTELLACESWSFPEHDSNKASLIVEWSLVCDRSYYSALIESSFFMGLLLGNIIWGYLADRIGRKKAYILSHLVALVAGTLSLVVPDVRLFIIFRFIAAIGSIGYNILYTIQMELIGTKQRCYATMFNHLGWGMGAISIPLMGRVTTNTHIMLSVTPLIALLMLPWAFWLPESSRWLMARGKFSKARKELVRAARFNGKEIDTKMENLICTLNDKILQDKARQKSEQDQLEDNLHRQGSARSNRSSTTNLDECSSESRYHKITDGYKVIVIPEVVNQCNCSCSATKKSEDNFVDDYSRCSRSNSITSSSSTQTSSNISTYRILCSNPRLVRDTVIIAYCSFSGHLFYYLQTINFGDMKNLSIEANFMSSGAGEWFSLVVGAVSLKYLSRRTCMSICLSLMASSFLFQCLIDSSILPELDTKLVVTLNNSIGTVSSLLLIFVVLIVNQEVYPTVIRQSGSSIGNTLGELGSTLAPWLIQLNRSMGLWRADILCATMCVIGAIGSQFLTKTDDIELVDI